MQEPVLPVSTEYQMDERQYYPRPRPRPYPYYPYGYGNLRMGINATKRKVKSQGSRPDFVQVGCLFVR
jgi:hypothetical protein